MKFQAELLMHEHSQKIHFGCDDDIFGRHYEVVYIFRLMVGVKFDYFSLWSQKLKICGDDYF